MVMPRKYNTYEEMIAAKRKREKERAKLRCKLEVVSLIERIRKSDESSEALAETLVEEYRFLRKQK